MERNGQAQITSRWESSDLVAQSVDDPLPRSSLGSTGAFALVERPDPEHGGRLAAAVLTMPLSPEVEEATDWTTLRVFAIDVETRRFSMVEPSGFDRERRVAWAEIDSPGLYGAYALPAHPAVREALRWLSILDPLIQREANLGQDNLRSGICGLILCQNPNIDPPQGICELCLGVEIPPFGMPEYQLLRHPKRFEFHPAHPCQLVNGPIAVLEFSTNHLEVWAAPFAAAQPCAQPASGELLKGPVWSPGGDRIALSVADNWGNSRLQTLDAGCAGVHTIVSGPGDFSWVDWNPVKAGGKSEIAFAVGNGSNWRIDSVLDDGSNRRTLVTPGAPIGTSTIRDAWCPAYAPDGSALAFLASLAPGALSLVIAGPGGANPSEVLNLGLWAREPVVWTRDGRFVGTPTVASSAVLQGWRFHPVTAGVVTGPPVSVAGPDITFLSFAPDGLRVCGTRTTPVSTAELFVADFDPQTLTISNHVALRNDAYAPDWGSVCV